MLNYVRRSFPRLVGSLRNVVKDFPLHDHEPCKRERCLIDDLSDAELSDAELKELNRLLPWKCFTTDNLGRRFGNPAWAGKRTVPENIPDPRIQLMHDYFDLSDKVVLEVGCFEGVHTIGIGDFAKAVIAIDARIENVVKTIVRCAAYGRHPSVSLYNIETQPPDVTRLNADVMHHMGVLYHLKNPVEHLLSVGSYIRTGITLDTHYCSPDQAGSTYEHGERRYRYKKFRESGHRDPFSGVYDHAKWLLLDDIVGLLAESGFADCRIVETRAERFGPRVLLFARRETG